MESVVVEASNTGASSLRHGYHFLIQTLCGPVPCQLSTGRGMRPSNSSRSLASACSGCRSVHSLACTEFLRIRASCVRLASGFPLSSRFSFPFSLPFTPLPSHSHPHLPAWRQIVAGWQQVPSPPILIGHTLGQHLPLPAVWIVLVQHQGHALSRDPQGSVKHVGGDWGAQGLGCVGGSQLTEHLLR